MRFVPNDNIFWIINKQGDKDDAEGTWHISLDDVSSFYYWVDAVIEFDDTDDENEDNDIFIVASSSYLSFDLVREVGGDMKVKELLLQPADGHNFKLFMAKMEADFC